MKYDSQLLELKNLLPTAKSILIALPTNTSIDQLAAALSLFLTLQSSGKEATVVCDADIKVGQAHLFGIDHIQKNLPSTGGGNLTLTLEGVAASDNTIPALEKLDWFAENNNLNLVFHVLNGQTFQPARIVPKYQGSGFNIIFVIGAINLNALGNTYLQNQQAFSGTHVVNIDTQVANTSFGQTNILDTQVSSVCEIMVGLMTDLGYAFDGDCASNLLAGIFEATGNLANSKASADTFMAVANCLRAGGRKPNLSMSQQPAYDWSTLMPVSSTQPASTLGGQGEAPNQPIPQAQSAVPDFAVPPVVNNATPSDQSQPSPEELPVGEGVTAETVEPEWLTPKIFKGSSLG